MSSSTSPTLAVRWFDGVQPQPLAALAWIAAGRLHLRCETQPDGPALRDYAASRLRWPEPWQHSQRQILLPDGGVLACPDTAGFDAWLHASGRGFGLIPRWQRSRWLVLLTLALLMATVFAGWRWGIPAAADATVSLLPGEMDRQFGQQVLREMDRHWLKPSRLSWRERQIVFDRFADAVDNALDARALPKLTRFHLEFRDGGADLGPNAFALPGGTIVVTDELVRRLQDLPDAWVGVLGHELGHVKHRHGLRLALRSSAAGLATGVMLGDFSVALAGAPALLAQQSYSRDFEREADDYARTLLRGARIDPAVMVRFFERVEAWRGEQDHASATHPMAIAFSSHPADAERIAFFKSHGPGH